MDHLLHGVQTPVPLVTSPQSPAPALRQHTRQAGNRVNPTFTLKTPGGIP